MNSTAMEQIDMYWGPWQSTTRSSREPSWEEQAFARDAGGCVWPPRSYSCSFCKREFRSAQALGGHMNVHRRDRALLRQGSSLEDGQEPPQLGQQPQHGPFLYRAASNPSITSSSLAVDDPATKGDVNRGTAPPLSYQASIIKETVKSKLFMSVRVEATDQCEHDDDVESGRMKRRRLLGPPSVRLPIFAQTTVSMVAESESQRVDHDAKVPKAVISNPSSISPLVDQQGVDLELRLGTTPKVT